MPYKNEFIDGWPGGVGECGKGSIPKVAAASRAQRDAVLNSWKLNHGRPPRIIEIGCGDLVWHGESMPEMESYIGIDVHRRSSWSDWRKKGCEFIHADATMIGLPPADIAIARAVLIHLRNDRIQMLIENLVKSRIPWILADSIDGVNNLQRFSEKGEFSKMGESVDLEAPPFNLTKEISGMEGHPAFALFRTGW